jgi:hypothetical protein
MPVVLDASTVGAHLLLLVFCNVIKYATMLIWRSIHRSKNKKTMELTSLLRGRGGEEDSGRQEDSEHEESLGRRHCRSIDLELAGVELTRMFCLGVESEQDAVLFIGRSEAQVSMGAGRDEEWANMHMHAVIKFTCNAQ